MSKCNFDVSVGGAAERDEWNAYVENSPIATICHTFHWNSIIEEAYGHQPVYLIARRGRQILGLLPLFLVKSRVFGRSLCSMPFLDYGGPCANTSEISHGLLNHALRLLGSLGADYLEIRQCITPAGGTDGRVDKVSMVLDLSPGAPQLWQSLPAKVRNQVRKAEKAGLTVGFGRWELIEEFYPIFAANMRDLGSPVHHIGFFSSMFQHFGNEAELAIIRDGNRVVGGLVALFFKDTVVVPWASSLREDFSKCPNNLLYWETIKRVSELGYKRFDFGRSSVDSGTYHFKRQWGAKPLQIYWRTLTSTG